MATLHVAVCVVSGVNDNSADAVVYPGAPVIAEALTTSGTAASTTTLATTSATAGKQGSLVARCYAVSADHYVRAGGTASATNAYFVGFGSYIDIELPPGSEISAVTA